jgi:DNA repair photolyase
MTLIVKEIRAKTILSKSKIYPYVVNPYTGCQHACSYCYARFMKRVTGHHEPWGEFVDVKVNAPELLRKEITKKKRAQVWVSGVCDPYQPLEAEYRLTRQCLEILARNNWPVIIQTRSPLEDRIAALDTLHRAGIRTYAMIAPVLPGAEGLAGLLKGKVDYVIIDRMNYHYADWVYRKYGLEDKLTDDYFYWIRQDFASV